MSTSIKYLEIGLIKVQDLYVDNYKTLLKEVKEYLSKREDIPW